MLEIIYWLTLNCAVLTPICLMMRYVRNAAFLPVLIYGVSLWVFLILGIPLQSNKFDRTIHCGLEYFLVILAVCVPLYAFAVLGMFRRVFPRVSIEIDLCNKARANAAMTTYIALWLMILCGVLAYIINVGKPPIFDMSIIDIIGDAQDLKDVRKAYTYNPEFRTYKVFFYSMPLLVVIVGDYLHLRGKIGSIGNIISILGSMILTIAFLHKQGPAYIIIELLLLRMLLKKIKARSFLIAISLVAASILGMFIFFYGLDNRFSFADILMMLVRRVFSSYSFNLEFGLERFPSDFSFFYGTTLPNPADIFNFTQVDLSAFTMWYLYGNLLGNAPMPAAGEFYVNFGFTGVLIFVFLVFLWLSFLVYSFQFVRHNVFLLCAWIVLSLRVISCNQQSFFSATDFKMIALGIIFTGINYFILSFLQVFTKRSKSLAPKKNMLTA